MPIAVSYGARRRSLTSCRHAKPFLLIVELVSSIATLFYVSKILTLTLTLILTLTLTLS